jgi:hypothetical protein
MSWRNQRLALVRKAEQEMSRRYLVDIVTLRIVAFPVSAT